MTAKAESYPLHWPIGWPRNPRRQLAAFSVTFGKARDDLLHELRLFNARGVIISSNIELRRDGLPYATRAEPDDPAIAVYFTRNGEPLCIPCDKWLRVRDNLRAVGLTVASLRGIERYATGQMVDAAFRGFAALPETAGGVSWWRVLGVDPDAGRKALDVAYKRLAKVRHPDRPGGSEQLFHVLEMAYRQGIAASEGGKLT